MTDEEVLQAVLDKLNEFDKQFKGSHLNIEVFAEKQLKIESKRHIERLTQKLEDEGLINNQGVKSGNFEAGDYYLTQKGVQVIENGGWSAYQKLIDERQRKAFEDARLAEIKVKGEVDLLHLTGDGL